MRNTADILSDEPYKCEPLDFFVFQYSSRSSVLFPFTRSSQIKVHQKFWMDSVLHVHYSLDAIQSDYSMFGPLKKKSKQA